VRVLVVTSQWPTSRFPERVPFLVREVNAIRDAGIDIDVFHYSGGFNLRAYVTAVSRLRQLTKKKQYDLIHGQFGVGGLPALFTRKHPLVVTYQGSDLNGIYSTSGQLTIQGLVLRRVSQLVSIFADEIILVSRSMARYLPRKKFYVIPGGIDLEAFRPQPKQYACERLNIPPNRRYILFAGGTNNPIKRYELAKQTIEIVKRQHDDVELLVANGVSPSDMPLYLNAASALLLTSSREGSPNIVKESLACDCPVASVNVGDIEERIGQISGCAISATDTAEAIAEALQKVLSSSQPFKGRHAVCSLDLKSTATRIIDVYASALQRA